MPRKPLQPLVFILSKLLLKPTGPFRGRGTQSRLLKANRRKGRLIGLQENLQGVAKLLGMGKDIFKSKENLL